MFDTIERLGSRRVGIAASCVLAILFMCGQASAQVTGATLSGTVTDTSGAAIPQARVSIRNVATGIVTAVTSNSDGFYSAPNLVPGNYEMSFSAQGFATTVQTGVPLTVGRQQVLNVTMKVGEVAQKVEVSGSVPTVELASSTLGAEVGSNTIVELPLNGRDWTQLATLQPAVSSIYTQRPADASGARGSRGFGNQMSISGTRPQLNNYRLDGISIVDYAGGAPGSVLGLSLGVDAVQEFSVLTSNYSAEYGRTSGGVINAVTRSGNNELHGDAYWFIRDEDFDARNYFDNSIAPFHLDQFGGSLGGPIQKDKTFFFIDYEGIREDLGETVVDLVPSPDARNGIIHNADGTTTTLTVNPLVKPFLGLYPLPNAGLVGLGNTGDFDAANAALSVGNFGTVRIDRKFSDKDNVSGTWFIDRALNDLPDALNDVLIGNTSARQMISLQETHTFSSSFVNTVRGGFSRVSVEDQVNLSAINPLITDTSLGAFAGLPAPQLNVTGLTGFIGGGVGAFTGDAIAWNSFQAYDDAFVTKGVHSLKFGFAFERMQHNFSMPSGPTGKFSFGSLTDFLTNQPSSFSGQIPGTLGPRHVRQSLFGGYLQDDWRLRTNLTLNLGLRYEAVTVPTEIHGELVSLPTFESLPPGHLGSPYFQNPTLHNFEPRLGFAWDPFRNGKTSVRGAFGIFDALPLNYEFFEAEAFSAPFLEILTLENLPPGSFPVVNVPAQIPLSELQSASIQNNPSRNYVMIWNLNVQRQLTPSTVATIGYVGNHGVHMLNREDDVNSVLPTLTPEGYLWPSPIGSGTRLNPNVGDIRGEYWDGNAEYDALEVEVSKKMSHGFQMQGSYTWGKGIDTGSASVIGDPFTNSISSLYFFCEKCRRGLSDYNIGQTFVFNYMWNLPTPRIGGAFGSNALGGWELGGIFTAETGVPITPTIGGDPLGLESNDPFDYPTRLTGPGCSGNPVNPGNPANYIKLSCFTLPTASPSIAAQCVPFGAPAAPIPGTCANLVGNAGRNSVIGPGLVDLDMSVFKNNYIRKISETFNLQFRAEFFNVLNRANFETPFHNNALFDANGNPVGGAGSINGTSTPAREIQFALKAIW
jgi:Carboxypeptidase regulatory-like domain/TonB dependent receptor/TonB-dependent Receptor Plug Domain